MTARLPPLFLAPRLYTAPTSRSRPAHDLQRASAPGPQPNRRSSPAYHPARTFTTTTPRPQKPLPDHYATLQVAANASAPEIKKSFYALSKKHHPDRTRTLPETEAQSHSRAFRAASEAYAVLADPAARAAYDRARGPGPPPPHSPGTSTSSAAQHARGGRPASGLSKRRTPFRGPPPSFYAAGGWGGGAAAARRRASAEGMRDRAAGDAHGANESAGAGPGAGRAQQQRQQQAGRDTDDADAWPFDADANDVPHFNRGRHFRTQSTVEAQLRQGRAARRQGSAAARRRQALDHDEDEDLIYTQDAGSTEMRSFFIVGGIVLFGCGGSAVFFGTR